MDNPFVILFVGIAVVIGMIIGLRLNAFIALITAAIIVSLLAPGELGEKVSRVATAFGKTAGGIGIVIALAAVIGKCLMNSGAASRIVEAFMKGLGEKRAAGALAGSGFVLSIPVFFDTVFYLLVPLARSLFKKTKKDYLKYVLAIAAGAAVTHTLVPPTPGPLLMAQQLGVSPGMMIGIGALIGLPTAFVGLAFASWLNKRMPIEMRPLSGDDELVDDDSNTERKTPGLLFSLLPILLPVLMIGTKTVIDLQADGERAAQIKSVDEIRDWPAISSAINSSTEGPLSVVLELVGKVPSNPDAEQKAEFVASLNEAFADRKAFKTGNHGRANLAAVERANRLAVEEEIPEAVLARHEWETPKRKAAMTAAFYGNANFALLVSAVFAILLYITQCRPGKVEFAENIESALMSGGLIILITSAGGAFGAMLEVSGIGSAIEEGFADKSGTGVGLLFLAFFVSALIKVAQGSTTVAVITASSILSAILVNAEISFHPVYIATAIGGGGLIGSWMNDSGFWIFSKMSGLTEAEALKSWTPLLCVLGSTAFVMTLILSIVLPLAN